MYKIGIIGTGYVGLVTAACFAEVGNVVYCMDKDKEKLAGLKKGIIPIYEPGLDIIIKKSATDGRLNFVNDLQTLVDSCLMIFIAVGTPSNSDGSCDLSQVKDAASQIGRLMNEYRIIINKSTVPVGTSEMVEKIIGDELKKRSRSLEFDVVSNPEFLKEGDALNDFMRPDRIIIGCGNPRVAELMKILYHPFNMNHERIIVMDRRSAEMTKYAANCMLATKISFMNEIANICEIMEADIEFVRRGIGLDHRIGPYYIYPGIGYGGSCFPKDIKALIALAREHDYPAKILECVENVNIEQKRRLSQKVIGYFREIKDKTFAVWGLSFKPNTDDMREASSIEVISELVGKGAKLNVFDPIANNTASAALKSRLKTAEYKHIKFFDKQYDALKDAHALLLITEWKQFRNPDFDKIKGLLKKPVIFDGRNQYYPELLRDMGFVYFGIGRR